MNMNDALLGSLIFNKSGGGGGDTPLEFTKTSILDKTQMTNIVLTEDYTNYPFLLFSLEDSESATVEAFVPTAMITDAFNNSLMIAIAEIGVNRHVRYQKVSNTQFNRYDGNLTLVDVFGVNVNKPFTATTIYSRGRGQESEVTISSNNILDNDIIFFSGCWNADADFSNAFIWTTDKTATQYTSCVPRRGNYTRLIIVTNTSISSAVHYMVLGIKFT